MTAKTFQAMRVFEEGDVFRREIQRCRPDELPAGDLLVGVKYSALNYKDALSANGHKGITRHYPHTPGIEAAGVVLESSVSKFAPGDEVLVQGFDLGMNTWGAFGEYIRVPADWAIKQPQGLTQAESMIIGAGGSTAVLCLLKLEQMGLTPASGPVVVTGATGGVGSMAVAILSQLGYEVHAITGKMEQEAFLRGLGAHEVMDRKSFGAKGGFALLPKRWAGAIDVVGGPILMEIIKSLRYGGSVAACGLAGSHELHGTVYPFILRGVNLLGIDSAECPMEIRQALWKRLATDWKPKNLKSMCIRIGLKDLDEYIGRMLAGQVTGRILIALDQG